MSDAMFKRMQQTRIHNLEQELKKYEWISVKDRLPTKADYKFLYLAGHSFMCVLVQDGRDITVGSYHDIIKEWWDCEGEKLDFVSHWMPFPKMPESEDDAE